ncbi:MAG: glycosyltransferase family 2 protein [Parvularculaceae bacterium]
MKLIVQIPCLNEEATLPATVADIPRRIEGLSSVEVLIVDDGSSDRTVESARACGVDHVVRNLSNQGLARSFQRGLDASLALGADIIVNTDGDNQYCGADIPKLIAPILEGRADIVVGDRRTGEIAHFSPLKKLLQRAGSRVVSRLAGFEAADAVSGFRAFSREAAMRLTVRSTFSYTIETLIQAGKKRLSVAFVPVRTNAATRPSRLFRSIPQFLARSGGVMLRVYAMYEPLKVFLALGAVLMALGALPIARFVFSYLAGDGAGMIQSLIIGGVLFIMGGLSAMFGLLADLVSYNRQLLDETLERLRRIEHGRSDDERTRFPETRVRRELDALKRSASG